MTETEALQNLKSLLIHQSQFLSEQQTSLTLIRKEVEEQSSSLNSLLISLAEANANATRNATDVKLLGNHMMTSVDSVKILMKVSDYIDEQGRRGDEGPVGDFMRSEELFLEKMNFFLETFVRPIEEKGLLGNDFGSIFQNLEVLIAFHEKYLLRPLVGQIKDGKVDLMLMSETITNWASVLKKYSPFCNNFSASVYRLKEHKEKSSELRNFLIATEAPLDENDTLDLLFFKPITRVWNYPLIFRELVETYESDENFSILVDAFKRLKKIVGLLKKEKEGQDLALDNQMTKLIKIQESIVMKEIQIEIPAFSRRLKKHDLITTVKLIGDGAKLIRNGYIYLFNDVLLICSEKKDERKLVHILDLDQTLFIFIDHEDYKNRLYMMDIKNDCVVNLNFFTEEDAEDWESSIQRQLKGSPLKLTNQDQENITKKATQAIEDEQDLEYESSSSEEFIYKKDTNSSKKKLRRRTFKTARSKKRKKIPQKF